MSKDKACMSAVKEVCQRCHLYKENCGMLDCPDKCRTSARYIDGYRQAEKDLELTWEDIRRIYLIINSTINNVGMDNLTDKSIYQEVLKRFKDFKEKKEK